MANVSTDAEETPEICFVLLLLYRKKKKEAEKLYTMNSLGDKRMISFRLLVDTNAP